MNKGKSLNKEEKTGKKKRKREQGIQMSGVLE